MRFAYADPPYIGQAQRHYGTGATRRRGLTPDPRTAEVDHTALLARLSDEYPDGWALSCSTPSLGYILSLCPADVRIAAWVKPFAVFRPNVNPAYAWEPVIFRGGRRHERTDETVRDWHSDSITLQRGVAGAKPLGMCLWVLRLLNFEQGDTLDDLYPGTGTMGEAVAVYTGQASIPGVA